MDWRDVERSVMDCTLSNVRSSLDGLMILPVSGDNLFDSAEKCRGENSSLCSLCSLNDQKIGRLEQRLQNCEIICEDYSKLRFQLRILEEEQQKSIALLKETRRELVYMKDTVESMRSRVTQQENDVNHHLSECVSRRDYAEFQRNTLAEFSSLNKEVRYDKKSVGRVHELMKALVCGVTGCTNMMDSSKSDNVDSFLMCKDANLAYLEDRITKNLSNLAAAAVHDTVCDPISEMPVLVSRVASIENQTNNYFGRLNVAEMAIQELLKNEVKTTNEISDLSRSIAQFAQEHFESLNNTAADFVNRVEPLELRLTSSTAALSGLKRDVLSLRKGLEALQDHILELQETDVGSSRAISYNDKKISSLSAMADDAENAKGVASTFTVSFKAKNNNQSMTTLFRSRLNKINCQNEVPTPEAYRSDIAPENEVASNLVPNNSFFGAPLTSLNGGSDSCNWQQESDSVMNDVVLPHQPSVAYDLSEIRGTDEISSKNKRMDRKSVLVSSDNVPSKDSRGQRPVARAMSWHEESVQCSFCLRRIQKAELKQHSNICELRTEMCKFGCRARVLAIKMEKHLNICPNRPRLSDHNLENSTSHCKENPS